MTTQRLVCIVASLAGGIGAGALGLSWLRGSTRHPSEPLAWGVDTTTAAAYLLLGALLAGCIGGALVLQGRARLATAVLCTAGLLPGLLEPRAFVVTFALVFAGLVVPATHAPKSPAKG